MKCLLIAFYNAISRYEPVVKLKGKFILRVCFSLELVDLFMKFSYKAKQGPSKIIDGIVDADNPDSAIKKIIEQGFTPIDVSEYRHNTKTTAKKSKTSSPLFSFKQRIKSDDLVGFTRQINDLVDASVPMLRSLQIVLNQTTNTVLREIVENLYKIVQDGGAFSDALAQYPRVFSPLYISMVRTGEVGGNLEKVLNRLADHLEKEQETKSKIQASLAYPAFILVVGILSIFVMLTFVIPQLTVMFEDLDQALPWPTIFLINVSAIFSRFWWAMIAVVVAVVFYLKRWLATDQGRRKMDAFQLKMPLLGEFIQVVEVGGFARTLGTLIESGVNITVALKAVCTTINNSVLKDELEVVSDEVTNGSSLKNALKKSSFFPEMTINMIAVGEETGRLDKGLFKISDTFERRSDQTVKTIISLLGPIVLVFIVTLVGFVVVAMMLPIFQMNLLIQ